MALFVSLTYIQSLVLSAIYNAYPYFYNSMFKMVPWIVFTTFLFFEYFRCRKFIARIDFIEKATQSATFEQQKFDNYLWKGRWKKEKAILSVFFSGCKVNKKVNQAKTVDCVELPEELNSYFCRLFSSTKFSSSHNFIYISYY